MTINITKFFFFLPPFFGWYKMNFHVATQHFLHPFYGDIFTIIKFVYTVGLLWIELCQFSKLFFLSVSNFSQSFMSALTSFSSFHNSEKFWHLLEEIQNIQQNPGFAKVKKNQNFQPFFHSFVLKFSHILYSNPTNNT